MIRNVAQFDLTGKVRLVTGADQGIALVAIGHSGFLTSQTIGVDGENRLS